MRRIILILIFLFFSLKVFLKEPTPEEQAFYVAQKAFEDKFYAVSQTLFEKFIHKFPQSKKIYLAKFYIAKSLFFRHQYIKALKILKELEKINQPEERLDELYYWLAKTYFKGKEFSEAEKYLKRIIDNFKNSSYFWEAYCLLAEIYFSQDKYLLADSIWKKIIDKCDKQEFKEKAILKLLEGKYLKEDITSLEEYTQKFFPYFENSKKKCFLLFYKGEVFYYKENYKKALKFFKEALKISSQSFLSDLLRKRIGDCLLREKKFKEAKSNFDKIFSAEIRQFAYIGYYLESQNYEKALNLIESFLRRFPESRYYLYVYLDKAEVFYKLGRVNDALYTYKKILEEFIKIPQSIKDKACYGLAWCYLKKGEYEKAIKEFENIINTTTNEFLRLSSQIQIADIYQEEGLYQLALENYNRILKEYPDNIYTDYIQFQIGLVFLKNNQKESARLCFRNLEKKFPSSKLIPQANYYLATIYFSEEKYELCQKILEKNWEKFKFTPFEEKAKYLYAKSLFNQKKYKEADEIFDKLLKKTKDIELKQLLFLDKAYVYFNLSQDGEAKKILERFVIKFPYSEYLPSVLLDLGNLYLKENKLERAERYYKRIVKNYSQSDLKYEAMIGIAIILERKNRFKDAERWLNKIIKQAPSLISCKAKLFLARLYSQQDKNEVALKVYDEVIRKNNSISSMALLEKAYLLKELRRYKEAIELFKKAEAKGIKNPLIYLSLGFCWEKLKEKKNALANYFKIIYLFDDPQYQAKAYFRIAKIYEEENKFQEASRIYKKIISLGIKESKIAQERLKRIKMKGGL